MDPGVLGPLTEPLPPSLVGGMLRTVIDPELGVNIVDLGLVYGIATEPQGLVAIEMTLTTPGCPLGGFLDDQIHACLAQLPQVSDVRVELVGAAVGPGGDERRRQGAARMDVSAAAVARRRRAPLLALAMVALFAGLWGGLIRLVAAQPGSTES